MKTKDVVKQALDVVQQQLKLAEPKSKEYFENLFAVFALVNLLDNYTNALGEQEASVKNLCCVAMLGAVSNEDTQESHADYAYALSVMLLEMLKDKKEG